MTENTKNTSVKYKQTATNTVVYNIITIPNEFFKSLRKNPVEKWSKEKNRQFTEKI